MQIVFIFIYHDIYFWIPVLNVEFHFNYLAFQSFDYEDENNNSGFPSEAPEFTPDF
jgi:hypothetical protein